MLSITSLINHIQFISQNCKLKNIFLLLEHRKQISLEFNRALATLLFLMSFSDYMRK